MSTLGRGLVASLMVLGAATPAAARGPEFDMQIERDTRPRTSILADLTVNYRVTVRDKATGQAPERKVVFAQATNKTGEKSTSFACGHTNDVDSRTPPGVFDCTVIVDHGGAWKFVATLLEERDDPEQSPVPLAQASVPFELGTGEVTTKEVPGAELSASTGDVAILFGHTAVALAWFACVALLAALALPGLRRWLSPVGCHQLERRLDLLVKATWVTTGLVLGSGTYLTFTQTAYDAPFSASARDAVFDLPYGKPYFLALGAKITLYILMLAATIPFVREARRRVLSRIDAPPAAPAPLEPLPVGGGVVCDVRTVAAAPVVTTVTPAGGPVGAAGAVILAGGVGIAVCVTVLKYLHELIETARGLL